MLEVGGARRGGDAVQPRYVLRYGIVGAIVLGTAMILAVPVGASLRRRCHVLGQATALPAQALYNGVFFSLGTVG